MNWRQTLATDGTHNRCIGAGIVAMWGEHKSRHFVWGEIIDHQMWWFMPLKWIKSINIRLGWKWEKQQKRK